MLRKSDEVGRPQIGALTGLRFVAAMWVVAYHYVGLFSSGMTYLAPAHPPVWLSVVLIGTTGVDFFFILSGFILAYTYACIVPPGRWTMRGTSRAFWVARFARIYPVYILGLALAFVPFVSIHHSRSGLAAAGVASPLLVQAWLPSLVTVRGWNPPAWSLSAEAFFYALFPLLLPMLAGRSKKTLTGVTLAAWLLFAVTLAPIAILHKVSPYTPALRLPEFIAGMCLGLLFLAQPVRDVVHGAWRYDSGLFAIGVGIIALAVLSPRLSESLFGILMLALLSALLWLVAAGVGRGARLLGSRVAVWLGEISYGVYILHWPVWQWAERLFARAHISAASPLAASLYMMALIGLAGASYRLIETPARRAIRARWSSPRIVSDPPVIEQIAFY